MGGLGWRSSHPRHRWKRTDTSKQAGVALDNRRCGARYIGGTYAWPGFVCRSVRPSFANAQPGCPVSADDRSHHRVLTAGPAIGGGNRPCGIISPKCDGLGRWRERGIRVSCADSLPIVAYDIASVSFRYFSRFFFTRLHSTLFYFLIMASFCNHLDFVNYTLKLNGVLRAQGVSLNRKSSKHSVVSSITTSALLSRQICYIYNRRKNCISCPIHQRRTLSCRPR